MRVAVTAVVQELFQSIQAGVQPPRLKRYLLYRILTSCSVLFAPDLLREDGAVERNSSPAPSKAR